MASTFSPRLRFEDQATGENSDTWGTILNQNVIDLVDAAIASYTTIALSSVPVTLTTNNGTTDQARSPFLEGKGTLTANVQIVIPSISKSYIVRNNTTGAFGLTVQTLGGTGVSITQGGHSFIVCDGTSVRNAIDPTNLAGVAQLAGNQTFTGTNSFSNLVVHTSQVDFQAVSAGATIVSITGIVTVNGQVRATTLMQAGVTAITSNLEIGYSKLQYQHLVTLTPGTSVTWDMSTSPVALLSLAQDTSISCVNIRAGETALIILAQVTGTHTVTWPTFMIWSASAVPVLTTTASSEDIVTVLGRTTSRLYGTHTPNFKIP